MGSPYDNNFRLAIVAYIFLDGGSRKDAAAAFGVSRSYVDKVVRRVERDRRADAPPQGRRPQNPKMTPEVKAYIRRRVMRKPQIRLSDLSADVWRWREFVISVPELSRYLSKVRLKKIRAPRRKKTLRTPSKKVVRKTPADR